MIFTCPLCLAEPVNLVRLLDQPLLTDAYLKCRCEAMTAYLRGTPRGSADLIFLTLSNSEGLDCSTVMLMVQFGAVTAMSNEPAFWSGIGLQDCGPPRRRLPPSLVPAAIGWIASSRIALEVMSS